MAVFISLLRGINVGGNKKLPMADLRTLYADLGLMDTKTLLQSGNAVFRTEMTDRTDLKALIEAGIEKRFGFHSEIILRSGDEIQAAIDDCPCSDAELAEPKKLLLLFLTAAPSADAVAQFLAGYNAPERLYFRDNLAYIFYTDGMARPSAAVNRMPRALDIVGTGRNWNTVGKLAALAADMEA